jgi:hypothetical protein
MKRQMICIMIIFILAAGGAQATVEDSSMAGGDVSSSPWTGSTSPTSLTSPTLPTFLPSPCSGDSGILKVSIGLTGPESEPDKFYTTPGKPLDFMVTVNNDGRTEVEAEVGIMPEGCPLEWFGWTTTALTIPAGVSRSVALQVLPDTNAVAGEYKFAVDASAKCRSSEPCPAKFKVQAFDYASETSVSGSGQFQINKDLRSMNSGIKSSKNVLFSGSVDALVKNEYLVDKALGKNANFQEQDAVDNYNAVSVGDALVGTESFKSSAIFGGVGAKVRESYDVQQMEFKNQDFTLHQTGSLKKTAEFKTADNFTGYYLIDAKQIVPGQKSLKEFEEYFGSFEINRRILFRDAAKSKAPCQEGDCLKAPAPSSISPVPSFTSPCLSGSCNDFVDRLNSFGK